MHPIDKAARVAGAVYLLLALTAPFSLIYVPRTLIVPGDAAATANNILAQEMLFRAGIVAGLLGAITFILVALALYRLLSSVSKAHASLMVILVLVSATASWMNELNNIAALTLFRGGDFLSGIDAPQRHALGMLFLSLHTQGNMVVQILWGLWLFPFGVLVIRSRFLPRILGAWLILNGLAYPIMSLTSLLLPQYAPTVSKVAFPALFGEIAIVLWLLIRGAKAQPLSASSSGGSLEPGIEGSLEADLAK